MPNTDRWSPPLIQLDEADAEARRILFLDDDARFLESLQDSLRPMHGEWQMEFHTNAIEVLERLEKDTGTVVVTDWMMPEMDGITFCRKARELVSRGEGSCYLILATGKDDTDSTVQGLEAGADDFISKPFDTRVLTARIRVGLRQIRMEQTLLLANRKLHEAATTDPLTHLINRREGHMVLAAELDRVLRGKQQLSLCMVDLDYFKRVNDTYGHEAGDRVLIEVAFRMVETTRAYDSVIRWGGEEFLIVFPHTDAREAAAVAERLRVAMADEPVELDTGPLQISASLGTVTIMAGSSVGAEKLVAAADAAVYRAKELGRDRVVQSDWVPPSPLAGMQE